MYANMKMDLYSLGYNFMVCLLIVIGIVAERFLSDIVNEYGEHPVSTDDGTWYAQA